ncbi:MAG: FecR domain-containing protein [Tannerella sp.]|jgi:ferric-dicitrate binding protein FerR (iron transport regulator)|nr:FecR domain-containing protein [Tannerella sp.]
MKTYYISQIIQQFFDNRYTTKTEKKVQQWLVDDEYQEEKKQKLRAVWDHLDSTIDRAGYQALEQVKIKLGFPDIGKKYGKSLSLKFLLRVAVIFIPILIIAGTAYFLMRDIGENNQIIVSVPNGQKRELVLPDGSKVWINAGSTIQYQEQMEGKERLIELEGEAYFVVAKDPERPFIVNTNSMKVEALGTEFNIEAYPGSSQVIATLAYGKIRVNLIQNGNAGSYVLNPDDQLVYNKKNGEAQVRVVSLDDAVGWKNGKLIFQDATFSDIIGTLERQYDITIRLENYTDTNDRYSIQFVNRESIDQIMNILKDVIGNFEYKKSGNEISVRRK